MPIVHPFQGKRVFAAFGRWTLVHVGPATDWDLWPRNIHYFLIWGNLYLCVTIFEYMQHLYIYIFLVNY